MILHQGSLSISNSCFVEEPLESDACDMENAADRIQRQGR
jgi:hypothetical protein